MGKSWNTIDHQLSHGNSGSCGLDDQWFMSRLNVIPGDLQVRSVTLVRLRYWLWILQEVFQQLIPQLLTALEAAIS